MMKSRVVARALVIGMALALLTMGGWAFLQLQNPTPKAWTDREFGVLIPSSASTDDIGAFAAAVANGSTLPVGFQIADEGVKISATLTGLIIEQTGERQLTVTIYAVSSEIDSAQLLVNGQVAFSASRQNGAVIDRSNHALATMTVFVPALPPYSVQAAWTGVDGAVRSNTLMHLE